MLSRIKLTNRHKVFITCGVIFGFITNGFIGLIIGSVLGFCISEITYMIDAFGKKW